MKKWVSTILCMVMVLSIVFTLSGCNKQNKIIGTWETSIDMTDYINEGIGEDEELAEYVKLEDFALVVRVTYKDDGTYKMSVDEDAAEKTLEAAQKDFAKGMNKYFEDYLESLGLSMSVDELLEELEMDMDALVEEALGEELLDSIVSGFSSEGKFEAKDGKLYMSDALDEDIDKGEYETYEISGDQLTLTGYVGDESEDEVMDLYPMTFKKVS